MLNYKKWVFLLQQDYLDFRYVSDTKGWEKNQGVFKEILFNMRADYELRYLAIGMDSKN